MAGPLDYSFDPNVDPQIDAGLASLARRQAIAQSLMNQGQQPLRGQMVGRFYVPPSPLQGVANMADTYLGTQVLAKSDADRMALGQKYRQNVADALTNYEQTKNGTPASTIQFNQPTRPDGTGTPTQAVPAVPGDPKAAVAAALTSPYPQVRQIGALDYTNMNKNPTPVDAGDHIDLYKNGVKVGQLAKSASPDATLSATTSRANNAATIAATERGQDLTDARTRQLYGLLAGNGKGGKP